MNRLPNKTILGDDSKVIELLSREDYPTTFDPAAYLRGFYTKSNSEPAINLILTLFPNIVSRLPIGGRLLDVGSGPTIHVPLYFRNTVDEIYMSDFLPQNREVINKWISGKSQFDWSNVSKYIAMLEGCHDDWQKIEDEGRIKVKGVLHCDVMQKDVIQQSRRNVDKLLL